jgi:hypothetical protein
MKFNLQRYDKKIGEINFDDMDTPLLRALTGLGINVVLSEYKQNTMQVHAGQKQDPSHTYGSAADFCDLPN